MIKTKERINLDGLTYNIKQEIKKYKRRLRRFLQKYIQLKTNYKSQQQYSKKNYESTKN